MCVDSEGVSYVSDGDGDWSIDEEERGLENGQHQRAAAPKFLFFVRVFPVRTL